jgi:Pyridoxamine 5'-phosphate oxidase
MAPGYIEYIEEHAARVPIAGVGSIARELNTTVDELLGGNVELPPGEGRPSPHPRLEALSEEECARLLAAGGVGRFVFTTDRGPEAVPVNYRIMDGDVVFRVAADSSLAAVSDVAPVSFEVDRVDEAMSAGWSVLVTGRVRRVSPEEFAGSKLSALSHGRGVSGRFICVSRSGASPVGESVREPEGSELRAI